MLYVSRYLFWYPEVSRRLTERAWLSLSTHLPKKNAALHNDWWRRLDCFDVAWALTTREGTPSTRLGASYCHHTKEKTLLNGRHPKIEPNPLEAENRLRGSCEKSEEQVQNLQMSKMKTLPSGTRGFSLLIAGNTMQKQRHRMKVEKR